jgi:hypothetical protein
MDPFHTAHVRGGAEGKGSTSTSTSTVGSILIDWIMQESGDVRLGCIKSLGSAPCRMTPHLTSTGMVCGSIVLEPQGPQEFPMVDDGGSGRAQDASIPRKDSGNAPCHCTCLILIAYDK